VVGATTNDPQITDQLYMAYDQPLPFDGALKTGGGTNNGGTVTGSTAVGKVLTGGSLSVNSDDVYEVDCGDAAYASQVKAGMYFHIKDDMSHAAYLVKTAVATLKVVKITVETNPSLATMVTGRGDPGVLRPIQRIVGSNVVFILPVQMVRYQITMLNLDPANPKGIPCLVREQGAYNPGAAFVPAATQIIAENVSGFKAFLSADSGANWAGSALSASTTGMADGWTSGIQAALNTQLAAVNRVDFTTTTGNLAWYRDIPVLVRLDITTRTAGRRTEYASTANTLAYKQVTQSVVLVPRHFGLPLS